MFVKPVGSSSYYKDKAGENVDSTVWRHTERRKKIHPRDKTGKKPGEYRGNDTHAAKRCFYNKSGELCVALKALVFRSLASGAVGVLPRPKHQQPLEKRVY